MTVSSRKQSVVWGGLLVLFGVLALVEQLIDLSFCLPLRSRSSWSMHAIPNIGGRSSPLGF
jgi:hypothetical protein